MLDVGCGNGAYTTVLARGFREVHAIDLEPTRVEQFRRHLSSDSNISVRVASVEHLELPNCYFDMVTAIEVLEHIVDLDRAVGEVWRVLRPGGAFLVSAPNRLFPLETHTLRIGDREFPARRFPFLPYLKPLHRRLSTARSFTRGDLERLMDREGFRTVAWDAIMPPLDNWRIGAHHLRKLLDRVECSPLKIFGVSIIAVFEKPPQSDGTR